MNVMAVGAIVFILVYIAIVTEKVHKTIAALLGAMVMIVSHIISQEDAFFSIDFNVIFLLISMMIMVHIMSETGVFEWVAIVLAQKAGGDPIRVVIFLSLATAVISALVDNVTTIILLAPVLFLIADALEVNPVPFLIMMVIASNIGGTATLIGDPPNILIGSAAHLNFLDFLINLGPVVVVILFVFVLTVKFLFRDEFHVSNEIKARVKDLRADRAIRDRSLLIKSVAVVSVVIVLFLVHHKFGLEVATIALSGASVLMLLSKQEPEEVFRHVEWSTIFFFMGLFIVVESLVKIGLIKLLALRALELTGGHLAITTMGILWFSAIFSAIIDNIPYTATMIPLIKEVGMQLTNSLQVPAQSVFMPLWWALALGACLGGNATIVGASANVIAAGMAKKSGKTISFMSFFKYGIIFVIESMVISSVFLYIRYL